MLWSEFHECHQWALLWTTLCPSECLKIFPNFRESKKFTMRRSKRKNWSRSRPTPKRRHQKSGRWSSQRTTRSKDRLERINLGSLMSRTKKIKQELFRLQQRRHSRQFMRHQVQADCMTRTRSSEVRQSRKWRFNMSNFQWFRKGQLCWISLVILDWRILNRQCRRSHWKRCHRPDVQEVEVADEVQEAEAILGRQDVAGLAAIDADTHGQDLIQGKFPWCWLTWNLLIWSLF